MRVIATAGHVDHGKSSLIRRLTGIEPDRWEEERRRGLTIDLGFAWTTLPSGREVGFVDVPGHERFIRNMLAGVGPVRLVLFVVAADEGWKPQSEEHLEIVDVLGIDGGVVALTKSDLVDQAVLEQRGAEVRGRLAGTALAGAGVVPCSATTGDGIDEVIAALEEMTDSSPEPVADGRARIDVDRSFTIKGAGTVVTGTLTGGSLSAGDQVTILPAGTRARVRSLQTHRHALDVARPASRVAANLVGVDVGEVRRGDVVAHPGMWRPTSVIDVLLRPVRSLEHRLTSRGAYKLYSGTAERDARLRLLDRGSLRHGEEAFARVRLSSPIVMSAGDRFVLREAGRRETVGGGVILDPHPPPRPGADAAARLGRRVGAAPEELPEILVAERGAVRGSEMQPLAGVDPSSIQGATLLDGWWVSDPRRTDLEAAAVGALEKLHSSSPELPGMDASEVRAVMLQPDDVPEEVAGVILAALEAKGTIERTGTMLRLAGHRVALGERHEEGRALVERIAGAEPTPPSRPELESEGFDRTLIEACVSTGLLARVSPEILLTPGFLENAEKVALEEAGAPEGLTVSRFRELLGTTRKYALPILGSFDERGLTYRDGDVRRLRD